MQYLRTVDASHNLQNDLKMEGNVVSAMIGTGERTQITIDYGQANPLIRVSDFLHKENGAYEIGLEHTNLTNLPIPFPSEQQLLNTAIRTVQANTATFKKETKNLTEYQEMMSKAIYEQQMKLFEGKLGEDRLSSEIMKQQIQKNITSQKGFTLFQTLLAYNGGQGTLPETFSPETIPEPFFKCIQGMDRCIEHATPSQLQQLNATIDAFLLIIQSLQNPQSDTFKHNKSELFSNATLFPQMMENTQNLLKGKTDENISSLNLFDVVFTHCFPSSPTTTNADIAKGIQCFSDFIAYNKDGNLSNKPFLAPIITAWDKHSVSPPE
ncbi:MAG: hypothetical protein LBP53_00045 [Candidatus Peribacteria bacterium]|jgi:hypothetical protein|nr:hypothetical protein [Candidatus Peribacteria bacterium]